MGRIMEYFVVCGLGPEVQRMDGEPGFHGFEAMYMQSVLDQFPPPSKDSQIPPQLPVVRVCLTDICSVYQLVLHYTTVVVIHACVLQSVFN
jgi:hypothetical protein